MTINISELQASLNKAYRLISPLRKDLDHFKKNLKLLLSLIDEKESEENVKIHLMDFLKNTFFHPDHLIATKGKTDFVIHLGKDASTGDSDECDHSIPAQADHPFRAKLTRAFRGKLTTPNA